MAAALIEVLADCGVTARYRGDAPGLWVGHPGGEEKICAFGINVHHRVSIHGFALNLCPDLDAFRLIVPCGLSGVAVTSVAALRGTAPTPAAIAARAAQALGVKKISYRGEKTEVSQSFQRLSLVDLFKKHLKLDLIDLCQTKKWLEAARAQRESVDTRSEANVHGVYGPRY